MPKRLHSLRRMLACAALSLAVALPATAQDVPAPSAFHGYELGSRYTITAALYDYYRELAGSSPRVEYVEYGRSIQGRPLPMLLISSQTNLERADEIRATNRRITAVSGALTRSELTALTAAAPAIVWIFIVDTDEEAGVEVLQEVAYDLATREDEAARLVRENLLVIMTPLTNPDSHARYVTWHQLYDVKGASLDPNAIENRAHWGMNTDGNAYGIDVNRDFGWFVTPEMRSLARVMTEWRPNLTLDVHSGPTVIFLPPFPPPYHALWPEEAPKWWELVAERASQRFGAKGWSFNTREGYEGVTSVSFGLSWAMLNGSVASFLFESFGGRPGRTTAFRRSDGTVATMRMAMDRHAEGTWSLLEVAAARRRDLLADGHRAAAAAVAAARSSPVRSVVIPADGEGVDPAKVGRLVERLTLQGVEVGRATEAVSFSGTSYFGESGARTAPAGSYVIDLAQPAARLARALLDPTVEDGDPQVLTPYSRRMPYYDVTWELMPLIFGVPAFTAEAPITVPTPTVVAVESNRGGAGSVAGIEGAGGLEGWKSVRAGAAAPYAYILPPGREATFRTVVAMLQEGFRLRVFRSAFRSGGVTYPAGTWALLRRRNPEELAARLETLGAENGAPIVAVAGPLTEEGIAFGDDSRLAAVPKPHVAVVADWPVTQDHVFGGIRSVLEADFGFGFTPVMLQTINDADLSGYTVVVLPHAGMDIRGGPGFSRGYRGLLDLEKLREYARGGGTVIAVQGAAAVLADDEVLGLDVDFAGWAEHTNGAILRAVWEGDGTVDFGTRGWRPGLDRLGRSLLAAGGSGAELAVPGAYPVLLDVVDEGSARVVLRLAPDAGRVVLDGFVLDDDRPRLAGRPYVVVQPVGRGRVIYFAGDPTFRGYWYGLNGLFLNALLLGPLGG